MTSASSYHQVLVDIATGNRPRMPRAEGRYNRASKFHHRVFKDGKVVRTPSEEDIRKVQETLPGTQVIVEVTEGQQLSELENQDSYSYRLAVIYMGAEDDDTLLENYRQCVEMLDFRVD